MVYMLPLVKGVIKMPRTSVLNLRIEPEVKAEAEELFASFGLSVTDAVNVFLRQSLLQGGFPFAIVRPTPNKGTRTEYPTDLSSRETAFGGLRPYANPSLISSEKDSWATAITDKHAKN